MDKKEKIDYLTGSLIDTPGTSTPETTEGEQIGADTEGRSFTPNEVGEGWNASHRNGVSPNTGGALSERESVKT